MKYLIALLLTFGLLGFVSMAKRDVEVALHSDKKILAFGDSLTYGHGVQYNESYPAVLQKLAGVTVINGGRSGESSGEGLKRLPSLLEDEKIGVLILCHGANDLMHGLSVEKLRNNISMMVEMAQGKGIKVLLIAVPDISQSALPSVPLYQEIAQKYNTPYVDALGDIISDRSLKSDLIHPNTQGYELLAQKIYNKLN